MTSGTITRFAALVGVFFLTGCLGNGGGDEPPLTKDHIDKVRSDPSVVRAKGIAEQIGVGPAYITALCNGEFWPRSEIMQRIVEATDGAVGTWGFLDQDTEGAAGLSPGVSPDRVSRPSS